MVMVVGVFGEDLGQIPRVEDQHPIQHLTAQRSHHPLADRIRSRRAFDDPDAAGSEDLIEGGDELGACSGLTRSIPGFRSMMC
jgi:hypothetical protein